MRGVPQGRAARVLLLALALAACASDRNAEGESDSAQDATGMGGQGDQPSAAGHSGANGVGSGAVGAAGSAAGADALDGSLPEPDAAATGGEPPTGAHGTALDPSASRVLTFDGVAHTFAIYDAAGTLVHDHWSRLGIDGPTPDVSVSWSDRTVRADNMGTSSRVRIQAAGLPEPTSTRLIVATALASGGMHVEVWALDGTVRAELELAERWEHFTLSPAEGYLFVERLPVPENSFELDAAVIRIATGELVWQGSHSTSAFARDDQHFVFTPGREEPVGVLDLTTDEVRDAANPDLYKYEQAVQLDIEACSSQGAVLKTYGWITDGQPLWSVDWDGELRAFDPALPRLADEIFWAFSDDGASAQWQRSAKEAVNGLTPIDPSLLGYFELDLATGDSRTIEPPDYDCPEGRANRFDFEGGGLAACDCASGVCSVVAQLPVLEPGWDRSAGASPDGDFVLIQTGWPGNAFPMSFPDTLVFDADGEQVAKLPAGYGGFDRDSRLLLYNTSFETPRLAIVELQTGHVTWLERPYWSAIVYE